MLGRPMVQVASSATRTIAVFAVIAVLGFLSSVGVGVRLLAGTLVAIGGNSNPTSISMIQELGGDPRPLGFNPGSVGVDGKGYLDPANPDSPYFGYDFENVPWPSQIPFTSGWDGKTSFEQSQRQGLLNVQDALNPLLDPTLNPEDPVAVAGYSSGANVVVREMRYLQSIGSPDTERLEFLLIASMNRPNGGIAQRFPGLFVPLLNIGFDGTTPTDTPYKTTDVSWEYDPISDFPNYPLNFLADLNALVGFGLLHANYFPADMTGPRVRPDVTVGNITYVTLTAPELPLAAALKMLGVPKQLRDLVEPALKVLVDLGYDRSISPGVATPASLSPTPQRLLALPVKLLNAVGVGIRHALNPSWDKPSSDTAPAVSDETTDKTPVAATALPQAKTTTNALTASSAQKAAPKTAAGEADTADEVKKVTVAGAATEGAPDEAAAETPAATEKPSGDAAQPARRQPSRTPRPHRVKTPAAVDSTTPADATDAGPAPTAGGGKHAAPDKTDAAGDRAPRHAAGHGNDAGSDKKAA